MKISLLDVDGHHFPNLALMKLAAYHKANGDTVEWYEPLFVHPDILYASKVFTFTKDYAYYPTDCDIKRGGTGYDIHSKLPYDVEQMLPDYSIYPQYDFAIGFLTRGCINKCPWCIVPEKEGRIRAVDSISHIASCGRKNIRLLDNNFLAAEEGFVTEQLKLMCNMKLKIDFNQALDCRLVTHKNASLLASVKWIRYIRFSCDNTSQIAPLKQAISYLRENGYKKDVFVYVLAKEVPDALKRIYAVEKAGGTPFCMPYRDFHKDSVPQKQLKQLARWCNIQSIRKSIPFEEYNP